MARPSIDVKDLEFFLAVYDAGGFSGAAKALGTVQSNVSTRVARFERRLGRRLFDRLYREVRPTAAGTRLQAASRPVVGSLRSLERKILPRKGAKAKRA